MIYGSNILSALAADWQITNGTFSNGTIYLEAGGVASQLINTLTLQSIPESVSISVACNKYANPYLMSFIAELKVTTEAGTEYVYSVPVIDVGNQVFSVEIPLVTVDHVSCVFSFKTSTSVAITDYALFLHQIPVRDIQRPSAFKDLKLQRCE